MAKAEGLKLEYGSEELINPGYLEYFPFDSPRQYIITETDEFSAVCPFSGLPDYSYLKIAEGCDNACSFCSIPLMRGLQKSQPIKWNLQEAERMVQGGVKEILVIAQDSTSYGWDLNPRKSLSDLLIELDKIKNLEWIKWVLLAIGIGVLLWLVRPIFSMIGAFKGGSP